MKTDLKKLQNSYFVASVENVKEANIAVAKAQGWVLTLGLAELAYLSSQKELASYFVKGEITLLLVAFLLFGMGSIVQYKHLLKNARYYFSLSAKITTWLQDKDVVEVQTVPDEFLDTQNLVASKLASYLFFTSFILIMISTFLIWLNFINL